MKIFTINMEDICHDTRTEKMKETLQTVVDATREEVEENKFHSGNGVDGKHYWLTPPDLMAELQTEFQFDFDACPYPKPESFDGLTCEWGQSTYANIPFGSVIHEGKKKGPTAWVRKAITENKKGKRVVMVYPIDKWILMMLAAGAKVRNLGDVRWCATEDGSAGKGTGRHIAAFILNPSPCPECGITKGHKILCKTGNQKAKEYQEKLGLSGSVGANTASISSKSES